MTLPATKPLHTRIYRLALLWALFFCICFSLGYPTLNRYEPESASLKDVIYYRQLVEGKIAEMPDNHWRYRVLVPYMARPIYVAVNGRTGSWNPVSFALLVVNSMFVSATAIVLFAIIGAVFAQGAAALTGALLFLCHFNVSNFYLSALVDSGEVFFMTVLIWALLHNRWSLLPAIGIFGALAKETFVPFSGLFAGGWFCANWFVNGFSWPRFVALGAMGVLGLTATLGLKSAMVGEIIYPWKLVGQKLIQETPIGFLDMISANILTKGFVYSFAWLLPLGLLGIRRIPLPWIAGSAIAFAGALAMSLLAGAGENIGRPLFVAAGPVLITGAALFLSTYVSGDDSPRG